MTTHLCQWGCSIPTRSLVSVALSVELPEARAQVLGLLLIRVRGHRG